MAKKRTDEETNDWLFGDVEDPQERQDLINANNALWRKDDLPAGAFRGKDGTVYYTFAETRTPRETPRKPPTQSQPKASSKKKALSDEARAYKQRHGYDPSGMSLDDVGGVEKNNLLQYLPNKHEKLQKEGFKSSLKIGKLSDKAELIAPEWTRMARSARRLRRKGYRQASERMALGAEQERVNTPAIRSQGFRGEDKKRREGIASQRAQQKELTMKLIQELLQGRRSPAQDAGVVDEYWRGLHVKQL